MAANQCLNICDFCARFFLEAVFFRRQEGSANDPTQNLCGAWCVRADLFFQPTIAAKRVL